MLDSEPTRRLATPTPEKKPFWKPSRRGAARVVLAAGLAGAAIFPAFLESPHRAQNSDLAAEAAGGYRTYVPFGPRRYNPRPEPPVVGSVCEQFTQYDACFGNPDPDGIELSYTLQGTGGSWDGDTFYYDSAD